VVLSHCQASSDVIRDEGELQDHNQKAFLIEFASDSRSIRPGSERAVHGRICDHENLRSVMREVIIFAPIHARHRIQTAIGQQQPSGKAEHHHNSFDAARESAAVFLDFSLSLIQNRRDLSVNNDRNTERTARTTRDSNWQYSKT
jgi:hypothetical protein